MISSLSLSPSLFLAFGIPSGPDLIILLLIVLVLFGAKRLPEIARSLGQSVHEFKKAKEEFEEAATPSTTTKPSTPSAPEATAQATPTPEKTTETSQPS